MKPKQRTKTRQLIANVTELPLERKCASIRLSRTGGKMFHSHKPPNRAFACNRTMARVGWWTWRGRMGCFCSRYRC